MSARSGIDCCSPPRSHETVTSRREKVVRSGTRTGKGSVFIPFHFREAAANLLTNDALDPYGKIPEFKFCAVSIAPA